MCCSAFAWCKRSRRAQTARRLDGPGAKQGFDQPPRGWRLASPPTIEACSHRVDRGTRSTFWPTIVFNLSYDSYPISTIGGRCNPPINSVLNSFSEKKKQKKRKKKNTHNTHLVGHMAAPAAAAKAWAAPRRRHRARRPFGGWRERWSVNERKKKVPDEPTDCHRYTCHLWGC